MSIRPILKWPDARLTQNCAPVAEITPDLRVLVEDMLDTMYDAPGRGLAAPQIGVMLRVFVMDPTAKEAGRNPVVCINPEIISLGAVVAEGPEGCLSIPGVSAQVSRPTTIRMGWTDLEGVQHAQDLTGFAAICAQHEMDHLNGMVTFDRIDADQRTALQAQYEAA
ncbi:peptide deformylase [Tateyamaria pelophila]|uniref:peptide deformylase n=1 Tax=Tateyamaria pelophila TaxID=328415 RepID=UPI001CBDA929|nr:peptide deformylase [Tateyamaria pelophila]